MSDTISIFRCRLCGKLMKRYGYQVYGGDESCCRECNDEADEESTTPPPQVQEMKGEGK